MNLTEWLIVFGGAIAAGLCVPALRRTGVGCQISTRTAYVLAALLVAVWAGLIGTMAVLQHTAFHSHAYDLGIFDQVVWNSSQGRLFQNTLMTDSPSFLGHHFSPILLALVPLYWIHASPTMLLAIQAVLLAVAGMPIFALARSMVKCNGVALAILLAYLLHPATAYVALFDFHEIAFATPLLACALYCLMRRQYPLFGTCLGLAFLVKEELGLIGAAIGIFIALSQRRWLVGIGLAALGTLWTLVLVRYVIPGFHPSGEYFFNARFANLGPTPLEAARAIVREPGRALAEMLSTAKQTYLQQLFLPLGALPALGWPVLAISLPTFLYLLLSGQVGDNFITFQYSAPLLPLLLAATIAGVQCIRERYKPQWPALAPGIAAFIFTAAALGAYLYGPLPFARHHNAENYLITPRISTARQLMAGIPVEASVIAQSDLVPQLSRRKTIQLFGLADPALRPDYYLFDTDSKSSRWPLGYEDGPYFQAVARVTADAEYRVVEERDGYLLVKRTTPVIGQSVGATFDGQVELVSYQLTKQEVSPGGTLGLTLYWQALRKPDGNFTLFTHLFDHDGNRWGQRDGYPAGDHLPTSAWLPGQLMRVDWAIPVSREALPGEYQLTVGFYTLETLQRLPALRGGSPLPGNYVTIEGITVAK